VAAWSVRLPLLGYARKAWECAMLNFKDVSDSEPGKKLYLVVVRNQDCIARPLQLIWPDDSKDPDRFSIGGTVYARE
jgi:hypothetical protein